MGIPAYFSHIVKQYAHILRKIKTSPLHVDHFYLDGNSIIYDAYYKLSAEQKTKQEYKTNNKPICNISQTIIHEVIKSIKLYIERIQPRKSIFIAFDGVAPDAKLDQQRCRRFKSLYQNSISQTTELWNTTAITPGTDFMQQLDACVSDAFSDSSLYNVTVSGSNECGEGEHKIFKHIREKTRDENEMVVVYGLDADLIMLSLNHLPIHPNIYLFRETPEFVKSLNCELDPNELYVLDIPQLANAIVQIMNPDHSIVNARHFCYIYDYVFLCFFMGNDFLPHFPALNIRTGGIEKMMQAYQESIPKGEHLIGANGTEIVWNNVRKLVQYLSERELNYFKQEHKLRDRKGKQTLPRNTLEEKKQYFLHIPSYERDVEKYINPYNSHWQVRYYESLLSNECHDPCAMEQLCMSYLQGLEWTMKYYSVGCPDWRWRYSYSYPPLLQDLIAYIPCFQRELVATKPEEPVSNLVQLSYVLPRQSLQFLPPKLYQALIIHKLDQYTTTCDFSWAYCKYFWECHPHLPVIDMDELKQFVSQHHP